MRLRNLPPRGAVEGINFPSDVISNFRKSTLKALHDCGNFPLPRLVTAPSQHFSRDVQRRVEHIPPQSQKYLTLPKLNQRLVIRFIARSVYVSKFDSLRMTQGEPWIRLVCRHYLGASRPIAPQRVSRVQQMASTRRQRDRCRRPQRSVGDHPRYFPFSLKSDQVTPR